MESVGVLLRWRMIRKLDTSTDLDHYATCWDWFTDLPQWAKDALEPYSVETFDEYMELAKGPRSNIGVFDNEKLIAVITVELVAKGTYELHVSCGRRPKSELMIEAFVNLGKTLFDELGAATVFSFTPDYLKTTLRWARAAGMRQDGVEKLKGVSRNKIVRWQRSIITAGDWREAA